MADVGAFFQDIFNGTEPSHPFLLACEDAKTPFSLMYIGSFTSCFITSLVVHLAGCGHTGKMIFWIFMFMLFMMQLYGDALDLFEALDTFSHWGDVFNCYARIVVNSANFKWSVCSTLCSLSNEAFQKPETASKIRFSDAFNKKKLWKRFKNDPVTEIFLICPFIITSLMTIPILLTHVIYGQIEYCWCTIILWMVSDLCITCGRCCCRPKAQLDPDGEPIKKTPIQVLVTVVFLLWQLGCYSLVYYIGTVVPVNFVSLDGLIPLSSEYQPDWDNGSYAYLEVVVETFNSRNLARYNDDMFFGENATMDLQIEYFWVIV